MTGDRVKKLILFALFLVAGYVWYGNVKLLSGDNRAAFAEQNTARRSVPTERRKLEYTEPLHDPFHEPLPEPASPRANSSPPEPVFQGPLLRENHVWIGFLKAGRKGVAIVRSPSGKEHLLSSGDSLSGWRLRETKEEFLVFEFNAVRDTLRRSGYAIQ